jgi:dTDP-4-amino-4,6-dideoxygalactose transaminase
MIIPFNNPPYYGTEDVNIMDVIKKRKLSGDGEYTKKCSVWLENNIGGAKALLTTSCTHALEMAALLCDFEAGDEVIMPSYTFVSTANAFVLRGAKAVFVDIRPDTMNIDETLIEAAITKKTKAIVPVHYAGVSCEMDTINALAKKYDLFVVEDAAQAITSTYKGQNCGAIGDFGCFSFHETKNTSCGEGGALIVKDERFAEQAEIIREKGTNRSKFFRGEIDKYSWVSVGSSYLPSELNAAYLFAQLEHADEIMRGRMAAWDFYNLELKELAEKGRIELPCIPAHCTHNAHMFYIKCQNAEERTGLIKFLKEREIHAVFHYIPLHSADGGLKYSRFNGEDKHTTIESERLLRLPLYYGMTDMDRGKVTEAVKAFYSR